MASTKPKRKRRWRWIVIVVVILVVAGIAAGWFARRGKPPVTVQTEKVAQRTITETVIANGRIFPVLQVKISPEVSGEIVELPVVEGQRVNKGDLLVNIKRDTYVANRKSAEAGYLSSVSGQNLSKANLEKAELEYKRNKELFDAKLVADTVFLEYKTSLDVARAQSESARHQVDVAKASLARADEELAKTTIYSPLSGTITRLNSRLGERVVGTAMMTGTEIMIVSELNQMEARVDVGEIDVVLIKPSQKAKLEVDAYRDKKFEGEVTEIANSSKNLGQQSSGQNQEATSFEVRILLQDKENFRPGMSVTAEVLTRTRTNVLTVPIQSVTTRLPKPGGSGGTNTTNTTAQATNSTNSTNSVTGKKPNEPPKPLEVVFVLEGDTVRMLPVTRGISDENYTEITSGLKEGQEVISGGYKAISRDLEDGMKVLKGPAQGGGPAPARP